MSAISSVTRAIVTAAGSIPVTVHCKQRAGGFEPRADSAGKHRCAGPSRFSGPSDPWAKRVREGRSEQMTWQSWVPQGAPGGGFQGGPAIVSRNNSVCNIYVRGADNALWQRAFF